MLGQNVGQSTWSIRSPNALRQLRESLHAEESRRRASFHEALRLLRTRCQGSDLSDALFGVTALLEADDNADPAFLPPGRRGTLEHLRRKMEQAEATHNAENVQALLDALKTFLDEEEEGTMRYHDDEEDLDDDLDEAGPPAPPIYRADDEEEDDDEEEAARMTCLRCGGRMVCPSCDGDFDEAVPAGDVNNAYSHDRRREADRFEELTLFAPLRVPSRESLLRESASGYFQRVSGGRRLGAGADDGLTAAEHFEARYRREAA